MLFLLSGCLVNSDLYEERKADLADADGDGFARADDCDDQDAAVHPGATESCDGRDEDCDGEIDEDAIDAPTWYVDADGDGYGDGPTAARQCAVGGSSNGLDCDDTVSDIHPTAPEIPYDGIDQDCTGGDLVDVDGDGEAAERVGGPDCDDSSATVGSEAQESWSDLWIDNNCDGDLATQDGTFGSAMWTTEEPGSALGQYLSPIGDVDGDGRDEAALAAILASSRFTNGGVVHVASGTIGGDVSDLVTVWGGGQDWYLGVDLDGGEDLDGDGTADLLLGAPGMDTTGAAFLVGGASLTSTGDVQLPDDATWLATGDAAGRYWGVVRAIGDFDGDGVGDVAVGAGFADIAEIDDGAVVVMTPEPGAVESVSDAEIRWRGYYAGARFGEALGRVGDLTGDGLDDVLVSAASGDVAVVVPGGAASGDIDTVATTRITRDGAIGSLRTVAIGDVSADGRPDVISLGDSAYVFTDLWAGGLRTQDDAEVRLPAVESGPFSDAADVGDRTGDGRSESVLSWFDVESGQGGSVGVFTGEQLAGTSDRAEPIAVARSLAADGDFGYRIAAQRDADGLGSPSVLVGGGSYDGKAADGGGVAILVLP